MKGFILFWWDFVVGDDWRVAAGVVLAVAVTAGLARSGIAAWWLPPVAAGAVLVLGLRRSAG